MRHALIMVLVVAVCTGAGELKDLRPAKTKPPSEQAIRNWLRQLGDKDFQVREAGTRALIEAGPHAVRAVRAETESTDLEVRRRALDIAEQIENQSAAALETLGASVQRSMPDSVPWQIQSHLQG